MDHPWQPIDALIREILVQREQSATNQVIRLVSVSLIAHLMAGRDFRVALEETIDDILDAADHGTDVVK
jgi:hypothetical protein